ncbi:MAG: hypothetical protein AB8G15_01565 [Saprospiraceae bacterium]
MSKLKAVATNMGESPWRRLSTTRAMSGMVQIYQQRFEQDNLTISVMNNQKTKRKNFLSRLVNRLTIKKNNVAGTRRYEKGKIHYVRKKRGSIFHQWWHSIQSGLRSIILADILLEKELR